MGMQMAQNSPAVLGPVQSSVRPCAWASSLECRINQILSAAQYDNCLPKNRIDFDVPLYDPCAIDAAVALERERLAQLFDMPETMHGEAEDWCREVAARIRAA